MSTESLLDMEGDVYVVERYESDVEEEKLSSGGAGSNTGGGARGVVNKVDRDQVMIRLPEGFLEEIDDVSAKVRCIPNGPSVRLKFQIVHTTSNSHYSYQGRHSC